MSSLTSLIISRASLKGDLSVINIQGLRDLSLYFVTLGQVWIQNIATSLPALTHLSLDNSFVEIAGFHPYDMPDEIADLFEMAMAGFHADIMPANTLR